MRAYASSGAMWARERRKRNSPSGAGIAMTCARRRERQGGHRDLQPDLRALPQAIRCRGDLGMDLTNANRKDRNYLLTHIVDPSVYIRKEQDAASVTLMDGEYRK